MLYFSPSSVSIDGIGVYSAEPLPKGENFVSISDCIIHSHIMHWTCYYYTSGYVIGNQSLIHITIMLLIS